MKDSLIKNNFNLPSKWQICKLEDVTHKIIDGTHHTPTYTESGVPFLRVTDVQTKEINFAKLKFVSAEEHQLLIKRCNPEKGDLLYSKNGTIGIPKIVDWDWEFSVFVSLALIKPNHKLVNVEYLKYFLESEITKWQIKQRAKQGTVTNLHLEEIREFEIVVHELPIQQKIAHILSTIDQVIERTAQAIQKYQAIKEGMMQDLFSRGIEVATGKLRPSYQQAPHLYKKIELDWVPKEWDMKCLNDVSHQISDGIHTTPKYVATSNYNFINGNNLLDGGIILSKSAKFVSETEYLKHYKDLGDNTILYSINGTIGNIAYFEGEKVVLGKSVAYINLHKNTNKDFVYYLLQTRKVKSFYEKEMTGTTIKNLSIKALKETPLLIPIQAEEQQKILSNLTQIAKEIKTETQYLNKIKTLKQGLMQDLLTGKVSVEVAEAMSEKSN